MGYICMIIFNKTSFVADSSFIFVAISGIIFAESELLFKIWLLIVSNNTYRIFDKYYFNYLFYTLNLLINVKTDPSGYVPAGI